MVTVDLYIGFPARSFYFSVGMMWRYDVVAIVCPPYRQQFAVMLVLQRMARGGVPPVVAGESFVIGGVEQMYLGCR